MKSKSDADIARFDRWAATYERSLIQRCFFDPIHRRMLELLERSLQGHAPGTILDVGCGTGRLLRAASRLWAQARLLGADPAPTMIAEAARLLPRAQFKLAQAESLPFGDESADLVFTSLSFHHWTDQEAGIREIARVLRGGGLFCLADHTFTLAKLAGAKVKSRREIEALLRAAGLTVLHQYGGGPPFVAITLAQKAHP